MNISDFDYSQFNGTIDMTKTACKIGVNQFDRDCLYNLICGQMNAYFIKTGIIIVASYIIVSWTKWWFFRYGWKLIRYDYMQNNTVRKLLGDFRFEQTRIYWNDWIQTRFIKVMILFIIVMIYFGLVGGLT